MKIKQIFPYKTCVTQTRKRKKKHMENLCRFYFFPTALCCGVQVKVSLWTDPSFKESSLCILNGIILKEMKNKIH